MHLVLSHMVSIVRIFLIPQNLLEKFSGAFMHIQSSSCGVDS
jgi:hypothetical protein